MTESGGGLYRNGPDEGPTEPNSEDYCKKCQKDLRDQFNATGGTPELKVRWKNLYFECANEGFDIDGLEGDQPPTQITKETLKNYVNPHDAPSGFWDEDWLGDGVILLAAAVAVYLVGEISGEEETPGIGEDAEGGEDSPAKPTYGEGSTQNPSSPEPSQKPNIQPQQPGESPETTSPQPSTPDPKQQPITPTGNADIDADYAVGEHAGGDPEALTKSEGGNLPDPEDEE